MPRFTTLRGEKGILVVKVTKSLQYPIISHRSRVSRVSCLHGSHHVTNSRFQYDPVRRFGVRVTARLRFTDSFFHWPSTGRVPSLPRQPGLPPTFLFQSEQSASWEAEIRSRPDRVALPCTSTWCRQHLWPSRTIRPSLDLITTTSNTARAVSTIII